MSDKPKNYFKYALALDTETTGLAYNTLDPSFDPETGKDYQAVSYGLIIVDSETLEEVDELYIEVKYNGTSEWSDKAQEIHGLSIEHLEEYGISEEDAVIVMGEFIFKYFGPDSIIPLLGHNVATFDRYFIDRLFKKFGINLRFSGRNIDTFAVGFTVFNLFNSDQIFSAIGGEKRGQHNALEDAREAVNVIRGVRQVWQYFMDNQK